MLNNPATHVDRWGYVVEDDPGGGTFHEWYTYDNYRYSNQTTESYEYAAVSGDDIVWYEVTITYTDTWEVKFTYYHNSLGYTYLADESVPRHVGRTSSSSREEIGREPIDGNPMDPPAPPPEPDPTDPGPPDTDRPPQLTEEERAARKHDAAIQQGAGTIAGDTASEAQETVDALGRMASLHQRVLAEAVGVRSGDVVSLSISGSLAKFFGGTASITFDRVVDDSGYGHWYVTRSGGPYVGQRSLVIGMWRGITSAAEPNEFTGWSMTQEADLVIVVDGIPIGGGVSGTMGQDPESLTGKVGLLTGTPGASYSISVGYTEELLREPISFGAWGLIPSR